MGWLWRARPFHHAVDYRSVVLFGGGEAVEAAEDKLAALLALVDKLSPGRSRAVRPPDAAELAATAVARLAVSEGSAKVRAEPPTENPKDQGWTPWTGTVPMALRAGPPVPAASDDGAVPLPTLPKTLVENRR